MVPSLVLGLAAGTIADRADRRRQLIAVGAGTGPLMVIAAWLIGTGGLDAWHVVALSFAIGCLHVFDTPARQALVLDTVGPGLAPNAIAVNAFGTRLAFGLGAFAAGLLVAQVGLASCYVVVALLAALSAALLGPFRLAGRLDGTPAVSGRPPFRRALVEAARLIVDVPTIRLLSIAGVAAEVFAFSYGTALPVLAREVLAAGPAGLGLLNAAVSVGGMAAVVALALVPGRVPRQPILGLVFVLYGAAILALAVSASLVLAAAVLFVAGASAAAFDLLRQTLMQVAVPADQRGRAVGIWVLTIGSAPVGHLEMGLLAAALGAPAALGINGAVVVAAAAGLLARAPAYRPPDLRVRR